MATKLSDLALENRHLPLGLRSIGIDGDGDLIDRGDNQAARFDFVYRDILFSGAYHRRGNVMDLKIAAVLGHLPHVRFGKKRARITKAAMATGEMTDGAIRIADTGSVVFFGAKELPAPMSAERLFAGVISILAPRAPHIRLMLATARWRKGPTGTDAVRRARRRHARHVHALIKPA